MSGVFQGLTRGVPGVGARERAAPDSCFEASENIARAASLKFTPDKLFLGVIGAGIERTDIGERYAQGGAEIGVADDRHALTIAGSRAGKGRAAIIPNMLRYQGSVLAIDPKGELALATAKTRAEKLDQKVLVVDPFGTTGATLTPYQAGFNPLAGMRPKSMVEDAVLITDALVIPGTGDPHWDESARTIIEGVILEVATADRFEGRRDLATVRSLMAEGDRFEDPDSGEVSSGLMVLEAFMRVSEVSAVREAAADFFERPERERDSVLSTARRHLRPLAFPEIAASMTGESFDLADLKTGATTIYLCLPGRHMGTCGRWLRLFVNLALQAMERTPGQPAARCPVLFVLDEFASLGHMRQIEDAAGQIAGYGVKLWPILQDLGQLKSLYKERWETFMGNAGILQFFGNNDLTTLQWISKRLGSTTIVQLSGSVVTPRAAQAGATGESFAPRTTAILEPDEVALVFGRSDPLLRQLIIRAGYAPMILQRAYYDKHHAFAEDRS
ncbi:type IV secretory system conjugative DNA transfer family protein [Nitratireductor sp.]|uniref:type IV secretory system conjugative DNA transfer family protein n=1 Tax=Nitratireductor sp. TaxID=1872084 RepID=UPI002607FD9F|nr:type IV secretory system conjugative DNA transfer family protein [Nitratireductor sp.]MCV0381728.1 type IV secretory system conjugative DNA transfer family protein [Nitratireductor sp.]